LEKIEIIYPTTLLLLLSFESDFGTKVLSELKWTKKGGLCLHSPSDEEKGKILSEEISKLDERVFLYVLFLLTGRLSLRMILSGLEVSFGHLEFVRSSIDEGHTKQFFVSM